MSLWKNLLSCPKKISRKPLSLKKCSLQYSTVCVPKNHISSSTTVEASTPEQKEVLKKYSEMIKQLDEQQLQYLEKNIIKKPRNSWKVVVGMSGGVDSSVAAYICTQKFNNVTGVYMHNWDKVAEETSDCTIDQDWMDASSVAKSLNIPLHRKQFVSEYWNRVFEPAIMEYHNGLTPNPDVWCNRYIKFDAFLKYIKEQHDADLMVTGHYARVVEDGYLLRALDASKDQSYFLSMVEKKGLERSWFPIGCLRSKREEVREIAGALGLVTAKKRDSVGLCFIGKPKSFSSLLSNYLNYNKSATFVDIGGSVKKFKGNHAAYYTIGQRVPVGGDIHSYFVFSKDIEKNVVHICPGTDNPALFSDECYVRDAFWRIDEKMIMSYDNLRLQVRSTAITDPTPVTLTKVDDRHYHVKLSNKVRAISPGQIAAFYDEENLVCLGAATFVESPSCKQGEH